MVRAAEAGAGTVVGGKLHLVHLHGHSAIGKDGGMAADSIGSLERRWKLQLIQLGITAVADELPAAQSGLQDVTEAAQPREGANSAACSPEGAGQEIVVGRKIAPATPGAKVPPVATPVAAPASRELSPAQDVCEKQFDKLARAMRSSSETRSKESKQTKAVSCNRETVNPDQQPNAAFYPVASLGVSDPSMVGRRTPSSRLLEGRSAPSVLFSGAGEAEQIEAVSKDKTHSQTVPDMSEVASKTVRFENRTEPKSPTEVTTNRAVARSIGSSDIVIGASQRPESGIDPDKPRASMESDSGVFSYPLTLRSGPTSPIPARHSLRVGSDPHAQLPAGKAPTPTTAVSIVEAVRQTALPGQTGDRTDHDIRERMSLSPAGSFDGSGAAPDPLLKHPEQQWTHVGPHLAEAGFHDDALGWVSVRAARDASGVHAVVVPPSAEAERTLSGHLSGLNTYLGNNQIPVSGVTLSSFENGRQSPGFGPDAQQHNGRDGCEERDRRPRRDALSVEPGSTAIGLKSQTDAERYELPWNRSEKTSRTHISLVA